MHSPALPTGTGIWRQNVPTTIHQVGFRVHVKSVWKCVPVIILYSWSNELNCQFVPTIYDYEISNFALGLSVQRTITLCLLLPICDDNTNRVCSIGFSIVIIQSTDNIVLLSACFCNISTCSLYTDWLSKRVIGVPDKTD